MSVSVTETRPGQALRCPSCLMAAMYVRLDKKGRPFLKCDVCCAIIFIRTGAIGVLTTVGTLRLLDDAAIADAVRTRAALDAEGPGHGLLQLVKTQELSQFVKDQIAAPAEKKGER